MKETITLGGADFTLRDMKADDKDAMLAFAGTLPAHDLLFLRRDIRQPRVVDAWIEATGAGAFNSVLAERDGEIVGCVALYTDPFSWSPHVGDLRVLVAEAARQHGLGRHMVQQGFRIALDKGLSKLTAQMTADQKGAITVFEELGFRGEALLKDHVQDATGALHDLVTLSCDVANAARRLEAYGIGESA
ncbi:GNAT family N-acetyltransferase [Erythrobacter rubeus]|uniref:GNAT family N-acetyltransferase n=1 Tax=Erythrobacter rubeus TaxID=2760803 RepID=A0ABR8KQP5_9SPHN|nr:GNAT family N-acetyltransferase [Erythrobacter rubeus]MBD2843054.1 GNAT family N-acetyltransferase [Erythrobacter rubeus]